MTNPQETAHPAAATTELRELEERLVPFARAMLDDPGATVRNVCKMPGHAGFSYGFTTESRGDIRDWYLRLPPPNVQWRGTADVLRQVQILRALDDTFVPHCSVQWAGEDLRWFDRPYFVVPKLEGDVVRLGSGDWVPDLSRQTRWDMARQAMHALAELHRLDWRTKCPDLGPAIAFEEDVTRWDRFYERAAEPERLRNAPRVRELLLANQPEEAHIGVFHGDFQWSNLFYSPEGDLLAIIDWELVGIGATLNDVGWIATFNDPEAWDHPNYGSGVMPPADDLIDLYTEYSNTSWPNIDWYRALAAYKFAIITGFNLALHRRGKRPDPHWEEMAPSAESLINRALALLES